MSQTLREARTYEEVREAQIGPTDRPAFHLSPRIGWLNDPNGFSHYDEKYHLFYQYHPYSSHWGPMHWGHAVSQDLLHWEYLPVAMAPDTLADMNGCFSGSAITLPDGRQLLMYTSCQRIVELHGQIRDVQTQSIAIGDGLDYEKYAGNPVITEDILPENGSPYDFRDPNIQKEADGTYSAIVANRNLERGSQILKFRSEDAIHWSFDRVILENSMDIGLMWECPDCFRLGDTEVMIVSVQDMLPNGLKYQSGSTAVMFTGRFDEEGVFHAESDAPVDAGIDFYAPQSIEAPDGRRIMVGWMQNPDTSDLRLEEPLWYGQMSVPRELTVKDGQVVQQPIRELESYRGTEVAYSGVSVRGERVLLPGVEGRIVDLTVDIRDEGLDEFEIRFAEDERFHSSLTWRRKENELRIDRKFSGQRKAIIHQRRTEYLGERLTVRLILDRYSAEAFINDGEKVMSMTMKTPLEADGISFVAKGAASIDVTKYELNM